MRRMGVWSGAILVLAGISAAWGQAAGGGGAGRGAGAAGAMALNRAFFTAEADIINQQLALTDEQKTKVQDKVDAMNKDIDEFLANAQSQLTAARRGGRAGGGGAGGAAAANPIVVKLQDDLQLKVNEHQMAINQILTPEQRLQWETYKLNRVLDPRLQPLGLTDDQRDKVKSLVDATAKSLAALTEGKTVQTLQGQLFRKLFADVLTDAQLGKLMEGALAVQGAAGRGAGAGGARGTTGTGGGNTTGAPGGPAGGATAD